MAETIQTISGPLHLTRIDELPAKAPVPGDFIAICPTGGPAHSATLGAIVQAGLTALGIKLDDLTDVDLSGIVLGDSFFLAYNTAKKAWIPFNLNLSTIPGILLTPGQIPMAGDTFVYRGGGWNIAQGADKAYVDSKITSLMALKPAVANIAALSATGNSPGDVRVTTDTSLMHLWDGSAWVSIGKASTAIPSGTNDGDTVVWDTVVGNWVAHRPKLSELGDVDTITTPATANQIFAWDAVAKKWKPKTVAVPAVLSDLTDADTVTTPPTADQLFSWDAVAKKWKPKTITVPALLSDLTDVDKTAPSGTQVLTFNATTKKWEPKAHTHTLLSLTDVESGVTPADGQTLKLDLATGKWVPAATSVYTKVEIDQKIDTLTIGLEHGQAVQAIQNSPPPAPMADESYIVGKVPTGAWVGQANSLTWWDGTKWVFQTPQSGEAHLVESVGEIWHFNGTTWVKVAVASTGGASGLGDLWMVGAVQVSFLTEAQFKTLLDATEQAKWVLADGRDVSGSRYATVTGSNAVPDLRGAFLRGAGNNNNSSWAGGILGAYQEDSTARPKIAFTADSQGDHSHVSGPGAYNDPGSGAFGVKLNVGSNLGIANWAEKVSHSAITSTAGAHTHTITGGGDAETRPKNISVNYFIKIN